MADKIISRVHFYPNQYLTTADFVDEQCYHADLRRRHNIGHHRWGIVSGLDLVFEQKDGDLVVAPGMAIDGYGRELVLFDKQPIGPDQFEDRDTTSLDVWLYYQQQKSKPEPPGYGACKDVDGQRFYRWSEVPELLFTLPDPARQNRRRPPLVSEDDFSYPPWREAPSSERIWPVFLGRVDYDVANEKERFSCDPTGRPYAGIVAEAVVAPSGKTFLQVGAERTGDPWRFAVYTLDNDLVQREKNRPDRRNLLREKIENGADPRLAVHKDGFGLVRGDLAVYGDLRLDGGAFHFNSESVAGGGAADGAAAGNGDNEAKDVPAAIDSADAKPWRIYREHVVPPVADGSVPNQDADESVTGIEQLRITFPENGTNQEFVVGAWPADGKEFEPILTVRSDGKVIVHGDLVLEGDDGGTIEPTTAESPIMYSREARSAILGMHQSGVQAAFLNTFFPFAERAMLFGEGLFQGVNLPKVFAQSISDDDSLRAEFAKALADEHPKQARDLTERIAKILPENSDN